MPAERVKECRALSSPFVAKIGTEFCFLLRAQKPYLPGQSALVHIKRLKQIYRKDPIASETVPSIFLHWVPKMRNSWGGGEMGLIPRKQGKRSQMNKQKQTDTLYPLLQCKPPLPRPIHPSTPCAQHLGMVQMFARCVCCCPFPTLPAIIPGQAHPCDLGDIGQRQR